MAHFTRMRGILFGPESKWGWLVYHIGSRWDNGHWYDIGVSSTCPCWQFFQHGPEPTATECLSQCSSEQQWADNAASSGTFQPWISIPFQSPGKCVFCQGHPHWRTVSADLQWDVSFGGREVRGVIEFNSIHPSHKCHYKKKNVFVTLEVTFKVPRTTDDCEALRIKHENDTIL